MCDGFWLSSGNAFDLVVSAWQETAPDSCAFVRTPSVSTGGSTLESLTGILTLKGSNVFSAITSRGNFTALLSADNNTLTFFTDPITSGIAQKPNITFLRIAAPRPHNPDLPTELDGDFATTDRLVKLSCDASVHAPTVSACHLQVADGSKYKLATSPW